MPLRQPYGARRYNEQVTLTQAQVVRDDYGHASLSEPVDVLQVFASVRQMSAQKALATFQQVDVIGLDIEFRKPAVEFNGLRYKGHQVHFAQPEDDGRIIRIAGWYQADDPSYGKA